MKTHTIQRDEFGNVVVFDPKGQLVVGFNNAEEAKESYPDAVEIEGVYKWKKDLDWNVYVWMKGDKPVESLDIIYPADSIVELINNDFKLEKGEHFTHFNDLPKELQDKIKAAVTGSDNKPYYVSLYVSFSGEPNKVQLEASRKCDDKEQAEVLKVLIDQYAKELTQIFTDATACFSSSQESVWFKLRDQLGINDRGKHHGATCFSNLNFDNFITNFFAVIERQEGTLNTN